MRASKKLRNDGQMVSQFPATFLRQALDSIPLWRGNHVTVRQLVEDFARYPYLQRLRDTEVLLGAMREGVSSVTWRTDTFAFAEGVDETKSRYLGLRGGQVLGFSSDAVGFWSRVRRRMPNWKRNVRNLHLNHPVRDKKQVAALSQREDRHRGQPHPVVVSRHPQLRRHISLGA